MHVDFHIIKALCVLSTGDCKAQTIKMLLSLITNQHPEQDPLQSSSNSGGPIMSCV